MRFMVSLNEFLQVVAIHLVILLHVSVVYCQLFQSETNTFTLFTQQVPQELSELVYHVYLYHYLS